MRQSFDLENDKVRVISSLFWIGGALTLLFVNLRVFRRDLTEAQIDSNKEIKCEVENLEKQLHKLKNKL